MEEPAAPGESMNRRLTRLLRQSLSSSDDRTQYDQPSHDKQGVKPQCDNWDAAHEIQDAQRSIFIIETKDYFWQQYKAIYWNCHNSWTQRDIENPIADSESLQASLYNEMHDTLFKNNDAG